MKIHIETIPRDRQRYPACGDYWEDPDGTVQIRVSDMGNIWHEFLVAVHELWEYILVKRRGIKIEDIDAFDKKFEDKYHEHMLYHEDIGHEPGDEIDAPYRDEHCSATGAERLLCAELGISWKEYAEIAQI
jgi:hypothetical protein